jgi:tetratricopeptide (TPR) repeat protein
MIAEVPREIGRWQLAQALELRASGQKEQAYQKLDAAMGWFPQSSMLLVQRADWRLEDGQNEEVSADLEKIIDLPGDMVENLKLHSNLVQNAGRFADAVKDWKRIDVISERTGRPGRAEALNGLAYARALANAELDEGLENVNEALELLSRGDSLYSAALDTRGYLLYLTEQYEAALADMNIAVRDYDRIKLSPPTPPPPAERLSAEHMRLLNSTPKSIRDTYEAQEPKHSVAVIHYHRGLVFKALGKEKEANEDFARAKELIGRDPDDSLF